MKNNEDSRTVDSSMFLCLTCGHEPIKFLPFGKNKRPNAKCPLCHSLERHRAFWWYLEHNTNIFTLHFGDDRQNLNVLHFAPEKMFYDKFSSLRYVNYYPVDIDEATYTNLQLRDVVDIQNIPYPDNYFDYILCFHVLEHIPDDRKDMSELFRVLRGTGVAYISVPQFNIDDTFENHEYNTSELRLKHYGQHDHVRMYGRTFPMLLRNVGFEATEIYLNQGVSDSDLKRFGIARNEKVFYVTKSTEIYSGITAFIP